MREFEEGHYWVQRNRDSEPEVALHDHGRWRLHDHERALETAAFYRIGRRIETPEDVFEKQLDRQGRPGA